MEQVGQVEHVEPVELSDQSWLPETSWMHWQHGAFEQMYQLYSQRALADQQFG